MTTSFIQLTTRSLVILLTMKCMISCKRTLAGRPIHCSCVPFDMAAIFLTWPVGCGRYTLAFDWRRFLIRVILEQRLTFHIFIPRKYGLQLSDILTRASALLTLFIDHLNRVSLKNPILPKKPHRMSSAPLRLMVEAIMEGSPQLRSVSSSGSPMGVLLANGRWWRKHRRQT